MCWCAVKKLLTHCMSLLVIQWMMTMVVEKLFINWMGPKIPGPLCGNCCTISEVERSFGSICRLQTLRLLQKLHRTGLFADVRGDKYDAEMFIDSRSRLYRFAYYFVTACILYIIDVLLNFVFVIFSSVISDDFELPLSHISPPEVDFHIDSCNNWHSLL